MQWKHDLRAPGKKPFTMITTQIPSKNVPPISFAWLELTRKCNLECVHCYAESGPTVRHGSIDVHRWKALIDELSEMGASSVQFIGGEPTIFPGFADLVRYAVSKKLSVEVYSNLTHLPDSLVKLFKSHRVSVATSYYSDDPERHDEVTRVAGSNSRTLANIKRLIAEGIPLRVGVIKIRDDQRPEEACEQLRSIGVTDVKIDSLRGVGRGSSERPACVEELCGACSGGNLAITSDGTVFPCVFARWLNAGNVSSSALTQVLATGRLENIKSELAESFSKRSNKSDKCDPVPCTPGKSTPKKEMCDPVDPHCGPCTPWTRPCHPGPRSPKKSTKAGNYEPADVTCTPCTPNAPPCTPDRCPPAKSCAPGPCDPKKSTRLDRCAPVDPHCGPCTPNAPPCTPKTQCVPSLCGPLKR